MPGCRRRRESSIGGKCVEGRKTHVSATGGAEGELSKGRRHLKWTLVTSGGAVSLAELSSPDAVGKSDQCSDHSALAAGFFDLSPAFS